MVKFLIGDIAGFDTDTFALVSRRDDALSVSLGATAGRCLQVLLEADGEIVTKRTLLAQVGSNTGPSSRTTTSVNRSFVFAGRCNTLAPTRDCSSRCPESAIG